MDRTAALPPSMVGLEKFITEEVRKESTCVSEVGFQKLKGPSLVGKLVCIPGHVCGGL
jgi:hypothetical protein